MVAPFILVDEIIWSEIARGIADAGEPLIRGEPDPGYSIVYPLLISPAYALFDNLVDAYAAREDAELRSSCRSPRCPRSSSRGGSSGTASRCSRR